MVAVNLTGLFYFFGIVIFPWITFIISLRIIGSLVGRPYYSTLRIILILVFGILFTASLLWLIFGKPECTADISVLCVILEMPYISGLVALIGVCIKFAVTKPNVPTGI